jgi:hypothetical protein
MKRGDILVLVWATVFIVSTVSLAFSFNKARATGDYSNVVGFLIPATITFFVLVVRILHRKE